MASKGRKRHKLLLGVDRFYKHLKSEGQYCVHPYKLKDIKIVSVKLEDNTFKIYEIIDGCKENISFHSSIPEVVEEVIKRCEFNEHMYQFPKRESWIYNVSDGVPI